ncbi:MAG: TlpA disulfide reductase family protein, partial [Pirellulales bacterium]
MLHLLLSAALAPLLVSADSSLGVGTQLSYRGAVEAQAADATKGPKTFDLTLWITAKSENGAEVFWLVDERGNGEFPWPARFGKAALDAGFHASSGSPALLYDRGEGRSVVHLLLPFLVAAEPLKAGADFQEGNLSFHVDKATKAAERAAWQLSVRDPFGPKRTLKVDQQSPLVLAMMERVIMGRGEEYRLTLEFVGSQQLTGEQLKALAGAIERFTAVRDKLNLPAESQEIDWKPEQIELLQKQLPPLVELAAGTALSKLATSAQRDLELQSGRNDALAGLRAKFDGHAVDDFSVRGLGNDSLALADLKGQVTVLHFWDYRDEPLKEPYGQVGYLDFMYHRRKDSGLKVYGVAVNGRLGDDEKRGAAERSVRKLKAFMNLSYPVLLDAGSLLKQFGDPRVVGGNLPLFVVIGPDQKIIHYHVGHYEVHQDQG